MAEIIFRTAPHNPPHLFATDTLYMLTASIYEQVYLMNSPQCKAEWRDAFHYTEFLDQGLTVQESTR
jgi:hypothetical protein